MNEKKLMNRAADNIRILAASMVEKANSGHPGLPLGTAPVAYELFAKHMNYNPHNPDWVCVIRWTRLNASLFIIPFIWNR